MKESNVNSELVNIVRKLSRLAIEQGFEIDDIALCLSDRLNRSLSNVGKLRVLCGVEILDKEV